MSLFAMTTNGQFTGKVIAAHRDTVTLQLFDSFWLIGLAQWELSDTKRDVPVAELFLFESVEMLARAFWADYEVNFAAWTAAQPAGQQR